MDIESSQAYIDRNVKFRGGTGIPVSLTYAQEVALVDALTKDQGKYNSILNNCGDPIERGLRSIGVNLGGSVFPASTGNALLDSSAAGRPVIYTPISATGAR